MPSKLRVRFGMNVCKWRTFRNLTQRKLAEMLETDPAYVSRIEAGRARPSDEMIMGIRAALDVSRDELHKGEPENLSEWKRLRGKGASH
ncbi:MAG: helix-turn-helix transcriptional regulator [Chthoniobacteraceae bacterium]